MRQIDLEKTGPVTYGPAAQSPLRRAVSLAIASALLAGSVGAGAYLMIFGAPGAPHSWKVLLGLAFVGATAAYWLWEDFIKAVPAD